MLRQFYFKYTVCFKIYILLFNIFKYFEMQHVKFLPTQNFPRCYQKQLISFNTVLLTIVIQSSSFILPMSFFL